MEDFKILKDLIKFNTIKMSIDFIKNNWILLVLLLASFTITIVGAFYKCTIITIIGGVLSLLIAIFNAYKSYLTNKNIKAILNDLDDRTTWHEI